MHSFRGFLLFLAPLTAFSQVSNPFAANAKAADAGLGLFHIYCGSCHGKQAQGGRAPNLTRGSFHAGDTDADLFRVISEGIPGTEMSSYDERLGPENIWRIITFLRSSTRNEAPVTGDAAHGEKLFWGKGACGNCHSIGTRGNSVGPDLSRIGRRRSASYLRSSIVDPSADIAPGYGSVTVVTRDAKTIRGIEKALDDFSVVLVDFTGRVYSFDRSDVRLVTRDTRSLMPDYDKTFTDAEMNDLLAFLMTEVKP